jgi:hypothetical protein
MKMNTNFLKNTSIILLAYNDFSVNKDILRMYVCTYKATLT